MYLSSQLTTNFLSDHSTSKCHLRGQWSLWTWRWYPQFLFSSCLGTPVEVPKQGLWRPNYLENQLTTNFLSDHSTSKCHLSDQWSLWTWCRLSIIFFSSCLGTPVEVPKQGLWRPNYVCTFQVSWPRIFSVTTRPLNVIWGAVSYTHLTLPTKA